MNIFTLDYEPRICAAAHVDKHVVKMPTETAQILCTVLREQYGMNLPTRDDPEWERGEPFYYKSVFIHHPVVKWAGATHGNFAWTLTLGFALCAEYTFRFGRDHGSLPVLLNVVNHMDRLIELEIPAYRTDHPAVVNQAYKHLEPLEANQAQYYWVKKRLHKWTGREIPVWIENPPDRILEAGPPR